MNRSTLSENKAVRPVTHARQVFRVLEQANYPGVYRRIRITRELVNDLAALSAHVDRVGAVAEAVAQEGGIDWAGLPAPGSVMPGVLEEAFCQLAGRRLGSTVFFDERLVAEVYDAIVEVQDRIFLERLLRSCPTVAVEFHDRAHARCEAGDHTGAMADYSRAIDLEPDEPRYYLSRARCLLEHLGNPHDAGVDIETAIGLADPSRDPAVLDALVLKARTLLAEGKVVQATRALAEFVKDAGAAVAMADWDPVGRGILDDGTVVDGPVVLEAIEEAVELLEAIPEDEELRMLDRLLRNLAGRL